MSEDAGRYGPEIRAKAGMSGAVLNEHTPSKLVAYRACFLMDAAENGNHPAEFLAAHMGGKDVSALDPMKVRAVLRAEAAHYAKMALDNLARGL